MHSYFIYISQSSVETHLRCGEIYNNLIIANCPRSATRPVKSHSGARGNILAGPPKIFTGPLRGENFLIIFFKMVHSGVVYRFMADGEAPKRRGARGS